MKKDATEQTITIEGEGARCKRGLTKQPKKAATHNEKSGRRTGSPPTKGSNLKKRRAGNPPTKKTAT